MASCDRGIVGRRLRASGGRTRAARRLAAAAVVVSLTSVAPTPASAQTDAFSDVTDGVHKPAIDALAEQALFEGTLCADDNFCPGEAIKRSTVAVWLIRALEGGEPSAIDASRFADVEADDWPAPYIERLAEIEITVGCRPEPLRYCPDRTVTRGQMASFLVRAFDLEAADATGFTDIEGNTHEANINALAAADITVGCRQDPLLYCPTRAVTRAQTATFLARALGIVEAPRPTQTTTPTFKAVTAGSWHSCGLRTDNTVTCWGRNDHGQADAPTDSFKAVTAGSEHSCGLRTDDTITCWGNNPGGRADAPTGSFKAVTTGSVHSCGLRTDDTITCWGNNHHGQANAPQAASKQ